MKNETIQFHETQNEAIDFLVDNIHQRTQVFGLVGAGGTGKSEILSALESRYLATCEEDEGKPLYFSATTNKAVSRLLEVLPTANTIHSLTTKPDYTKLYNQLNDFYGNLKDVKEDKDHTEDENRKQFVKDSILSYTMKNFVDLKNITLEDHRSLNDLLGYLNMSCFSEEMFNGYEIKDPVFGVLVVDEASMLPTKSEYYKGSLITIGLDVATEVFTNVILVGDSSQLPPINGESSFEDIDTYELTVNFRSEVDLLEAIAYARAGNNFHNFTSNSSNVKVVYEITDEWYERTFGQQSVVHIVYRNKTRHEITKKVRKGHGSRPINGEPIMLRGKGNAAVQKGEIGYWNDGQIEFESSSEYFSRWDNFDEYCGTKYGKYQYGYAITCHLAQGSSFDHVIVHAYDIPQFLTSEEKRKWFYTAISRARKSLTIIL